MMVQKIHIQFTIAFMALFIGFAFVLPAFAHGDATTQVRKDLKLKTSTSTESRKDKVKKDVDITCMQTAVDTREASLVSAFGTFHDDMEEGLDARKSALNTAWGLTVAKDRALALRDAWKAWKTDQRDALKTFKDARKSAWDTFRNTAKSSCKETLPADEALLKDESGSISI